VSLDTLFSPFMGSFSPVSNTAERSAAEKSVEEGGEGKGFEEAPGAVRAACGAAGAAGGAALAGAPKEAPAAPSAGVLAAPYFSVLLSSSPAFFPRYAPASIPVSLSTPFAQV
jgi:hypothetical protein